MNKSTECNSCISLHPQEMKKRLRERACDTERTVFSAFLLMFLVSARLASRSTWNVLVTFGGSSEGGSLVCVFACLTTCVWRDSGGFKDLESWLVPRYVGPCFRWGSSVVPFSLIFSQCYRGCVKKAVITNEV